MHQCYVACGCQHIVQTALRPTLRSEHRVSQTTSRWGQADSITFWSRRSYTLHCILIPDVNGMWLRWANDQQWTPHFTFNEKTLQVFQRWYMCFDAFCESPPMGLCDKLVYVHGMVLAERRCWRTVHRDTFMVHNLWGSILLKWQALFSLIVNPSTSARFWAGCRAVFELEEHR